MPLFVSLAFLILSPIAYGVSLPLKTNGRFIVDSKGIRVKIKAINWYGASDALHVPLGLDKRPLKEITQTIKTLGFNAVRLPFSNEMLRHSKPIPTRLVTANPPLYDQKPLEIFDEVIQALTEEGLLVILNNHTTEGQWCCSRNDGNGLWYHKNFTEDEWLKDWLFLAQRYQSLPLVVGADLRNELRINKKEGIKPVWGGNGANDWHRAAKRAGNALLAVNPDLLIIVEGLGLSSTLEQVYHLPLSFKIPNRLVYSIHVYHFFIRDKNRSYAKSHQAWGNRWGYILKPQKPYTAPILVGEFGIGHGEHRADKTSRRLWDQFLCYMQTSDLDFAYWALNGEKLTRQAVKNLPHAKKPLFRSESYGLLNRRWQPIQEDGRLKDLHHYLMPTRQGPSVESPPPYHPCRL